MLRPQRARTRAFHRQSIRHLIPLHVDMSWDMLPPDFSSWRRHFLEQHFPDGDGDLQLTRRGCPSP